MDKFGDWDLNPSSRPSSRDMIAFNLTTVPVYLGIDIF